MSIEDDFRLRPGRSRSRGSQGARVPRFVAQVLAAAGRAPGARLVRGNRGGAGRGAGRSRFGRGRSAFARSRLFGSERRVLVKILPVRQRGAARRSAPLMAHIAYLQRDGVTRDGGQARMFGADGDRADEADFAARCRDDRHHFRIIVSPEDAADLENLRDFTRDLVRQMEADLGTRLEWIAVDHWNTDNPHVHLVVRGIDECGENLVISRDYIAHGLRSRAEELAYAELGPRPQHEIERALDREIGAERLTRLDAELARGCNEERIVDLRPGDIGPCDPRLRRLLIGRLQQLETMGLAEEAAPGRWMIASDARARLTDLGERGDIIRTIGRSLERQGETRALDTYAIAPAHPERPIVGQLIGRGLHDEQSGSAYAVIDGTDGRVHHVRLPDLASLEQAPPGKGIVELRAVAGGQGALLVLATRSDFDLAAQVTAPGATWLDHRLVERGTGIAGHGFGARVQAAMEARIDHLAAQGLARRFGARVVFEPDLLGRLRRQELEAVAGRIALDTGLVHRPLEEGGSIAGTCRRRLALSSGRFAMIDDGLGFSLVPWNRSLERELGRDVSGAVRTGGGIDWSVGRKRGLGR